MNVQEQLDDFDSVLYDYLDHQIVFHMNRAFWEEIDAPDVESVKGLQDVVDWAFDPMFERYKHSKSVTKILEDWHDKFSDILWIAMNVPYPQNLDMHADRVLGNLKQLYYDKVYDSLEREMLQENHKVHVIQRTWRRAISDPNYPACEKRLRREAQEIMDL